MYWTGGSNADWGTVANWTGTANIVPSNDGAFFQNDKFSERFKTDADNKYVVTFSAAETNTWNTYFNNCGTAENPIILRATKASYGLTTGAGTSKNVLGLYIGTNLKTGAGSADPNAGTGNAYVRFENGTFKTGSWANWWIGNGTYAGHVVAVDSTIESLHQFRLYNGSFTATNCTFAAIYSNSYIGDSNGKTGTMKFVDSTATFNGAELRLASCDGSSGELIVESGTVSCGKWIEVGYKGKAKVVVGGGEGNSTATLTITSEDILFGAWLVPDAATNSVTVKTGGTLCARNVRYHNGNSAGEKSMAHFIFDGGTLKLQADSGLVFQSDNSNKRQACSSNPVALSKKFKIYVTANGGTIDTQGKLLTSPIPFEGAPKSAGGGMTFKGGGTFTNEVDSTYTGNTTIELGTMLVVPTKAGFGGGIVVALPSSAPKPGVYTVATLTGSGTFTSSDLEGIVAPEGCSLAVANGGKSVICVYGAPGCVWIGGGADNKFSTAGNWLGGNIPVAGGTTPIFINNSGTISNDIAGLTPSSITFGALSATATINGEGFSSVKAVTNLTTASKTHRFNAAVSGNAFELYNASANSCAIFSGGATVNSVVLKSAVASENAYSLAGIWSIAQTPWTPNQYYTVRGDAQVTLAGQLKNPGALTLYGPSTSTWISAKSMLVDSSHSAAYLTVRNSGAIKIEGELRMTKGADIYLENKDNTNSKSGIIECGSMVYASTADKYLYINCTNVIGSGGMDLSSTGSACFYHTPLAPTLFARDDAFEIKATGGQSSMRYNIDNTTVTLNTTKYGTPSTPATITVSGILQDRNTSKGWKGKLDIRGCGTVVVDSISLYTNGTDVRDTATLAINAGKRAGTGTITVYSGATLAFPQVNRASLGGDLTLNAGSTLAFKVADNSCSVLARNSKTINLPTSGKVKVKLTEDSQLAVGKSYTLTDGAGLTDASKFELADGVGGSLSVSENGELVYTAPTYFYIKVK